MRNEPFRLRYANQIVGAFLLFAVVGSTLLLVFYSSQVHLWSKTVNYKAKLSERVAGDLRENAEVVVLGRNIGRVKSISYAGNSDTLNVILAIYADSSHLITTESKLSLERKFGVGTLYIKVARSPGEKNAKPATPLEPESEIRLEEAADRVDDMAKQVERVGNSVDAFEKSASPAMNSFKSTSDVLKFEGQDTLESVRATSQQLQLHTREMSESIQALSQLMQDFIQVEVSKSVSAATAASDSAKEAADKFKTTSEALDAKSAKTNEDIQKTLAQMRETLQLIQKLTNESREVVQVMRGEAEELPGTTYKINNTVEDTQALVEQVRSHWILRGTRSPPAGAEPIKPSSIRAEGSR